MLSAKRFLHAFILSSRLGLARLRAAAASGMQATGPRREGSDSAQFFRLPE